MGTPYLCRKGMLKTSRELDGIGMCSLGKKRWPLQNQKLGMMPIWKTKFALCKSRTEALYY